MSIESASSSPDLARRTATYSSHVRIGVGHGLSEVDVAQRQRYFENSSFSGAESHAASIASQPLEPTWSSSFELHHFIQQQRKIISTFRAQPWSMQMKLAALRNYRRNVSKYIPQLNTIDTFRDSSGQIFRRLQRKLRGLLQYFTVWGTIIKKIEGNFGSSVASFFTFLRWLCAVNLGLTLLIVGFLLIPQVLIGHGLDVPESVKQNTSAVSFILDGKGYAFEYSILFYGYYDSGSGEPYYPPPPNPHPHIGLHYHLPLAYLLVIVSLFIISAAALLFSMAEKYKLVQRANASEHYSFTWRVFVSWDFAITEPRTASAKQKQISVTLKETIAEAKKKEDPGLKVKCRQWTFRFLTNAIVLVFLVGSSYAIFLSVENAENTGAVYQRSFQSALASGWDGIWQLIISFQVQIVIVARNVILPIIFTLAEYAESFHPRTALKMMLIRMFLLYFSSLYVLMISLFTLTKHCNSADESTCCWETNIGQELYKLTITHLLADLSNIALVDGGRWAISKMNFCRYCNRFNTWFNKWIGPAEFQLANNVLKLVYGQALILFGVLFCPLLPGIGFFKSILLFYCRALSVYLFNKSPSTLFRVASTRNFYMALLLFTVFLCALPVGYAMVEMMPSHTCGPFRGLPSMMQIVFNEIELWPSFIQTVFSYLKKATVVVPLMAVLGGLIYYYAALSHALKEVNKDLRLQLRVEQAEHRELIAKEVAAGDDRPRNSSRQSERHQQLQEALQEELKLRMDATKQRQTAGRRLGLAGTSINGTGVNTTTDAHHHHSSMPYSANHGSDRENAVSGLGNKVYWEPKPKRKAPPPPTEATPTNTATATGTLSTRFQLHHHHQHHDNSHLHPHRYHRQHAHHGRRNSVRYNSMMPAATSVDRDSGTSNDVDGSSSSSQRNQQTALYAEFPTITLTKEHTHNN